MGGNLIRTNLVPETCSFISLDTVDNLLLNYTCRYKALSQKGAERLVEKNLCSNGRKVKVILLHTMTSIVYFNLSCSFLSKGSL